jgi:hypothetical protein
MKHPNLLRIAAFAAVLGAGGVLAETGADTGQAPTPGSAPVATDVAPPPAEDRASPGAVVLENSLVRAQREKQFDRSAARNGVASVGQGAVRATMRERTEADLAQAKRDERLDLRVRGAGTLTKQ